MVVRDLNFHHIFLSSIIGSLHYFQYAAIINSIEMFTEALTFYFQIMVKFKSRTLIVERYSDVFEENSTAILPLSAAFLLPLARTLPYNKQ